MNIKQSSILKPTLLLDKSKAMRNIERMIDKAQKGGVRFRPHFKTHQSSQIGEWFRDSNINSITVSSVEMAMYFAQHQWRDITIAFPVNIREIENINELAQKIFLNLLVESKETVVFLSNNLKADVAIWMKIDVGYHRTGILWDHVDEVITLADQIKKSNKMSFKGLLIHAGHTYHAKSPEEVKGIYRDTIQRFQNLRARLQSGEFAQVELSIGDTPSCSIVEDFNGIDEIRPGNFVFYDAMQLNIGSCAEEDIAVAVVCPVVAKHIERNEIVIYGGAVHLSKEFIIDKNGNKVFGYVALLEENGWSSMIENTYVSALSQEHGIIKTEGNFFNKVNIGDVLPILPVHSCLTVNLLRKYLTLDGETITTML